MEREIDCYGNGSKCVSIDKQCDGVTDCPNGKDESADECGTPEGIRRRILFVKLITKLFTDTVLNTLLSSLQHVILKFLFASETFC